MRNSLIRWSLAMLVFLTILRWSPPVRADVFTGTVGVIRVVSSANGQQAWIGFKFTDPAITQGCTHLGMNTSALAANHALLEPGSANTRELYAMLLAAKKSGTIICTTFGTKAQDGGCRVLYCDLQ